LQCSGQGRGIPVASIPPPTAGMFIYTSHACLNAERAKGLNRWVELVVLVNDMESFLDWSASCTDISDGTPAIIVPFHAELPPVAASVAFRKPDGAPFDCLPVAQRGVINRHRRGRKQPHEPCRLIPSSTLARGLPENRGQCRPAAPDRLGSSLNRTTCL